MSNVRSQTGVLWFLPSPSAPSLPLSLKYILKKDYEWNILWEISTDCYSCGEVLESVTVPEMFLVPLHPQYFSQPARQMQGAINQSSNSNDKAFGEKQLTKEQSEVLVCI